MATGAAAQPGNIGSAPPPAPQQQPQKPQLLAQSHQPAASWVLTSHDASVARQLAAGLALPLPIAQVLACRGVRSVDEARAYLFPELAHLHEPHRMHGMAAALERTLAALRACEPILIYGDYDVDGTVATVLLKTALERAAANLGVAADVRFHIPHRIRDGYGMHALPLQDAAAAGVRLVISVDTGVRAFAAAEEAARLGLDLIITDHHLPEHGGAVPAAVAVLNPNQPGCTYPCKELCGAAVAFKLAQALLEATAPDAAALERLRTRTLPSFLKLLAIATIADSVPLTGENRVIASLGLAELRNPAQSGLRSLMEFAGIDLARGVSTFDVGFRLAPRLNAAGRMDVASDVVTLFTTADAAAARGLAEKLHGLNADRRAVEAEALAEIEELIERWTLEPGGLPACVVVDDAQVPSGSRWHRGVIGILASRVVERTGRPALVIAHQDGEAHGSGRSSHGVHLLDALTAAHTAGSTPLFTRFGGHAAAAGFALPSAHVETLRTRIAAEVALRFDPDAVPPELACTAELTLSELTPEFFAWLTRLEPAGHGAPEPLWMARGLRVAETPRFFGTGQHLRLVLTDRGGARMPAVAWGRRTSWTARAAELGLAAGAHVDAAFRLRLNAHPDFGGWEMDVEALKRSVR